MAEQRKCLGARRVVTVCAFPLQWEPATQRESALLFRCSAGALFGASKKTARLWRAMWLTCEALASVSVGKIHIILVSKRLELLARRPALLVQRQRLLGLRKALGSRQLRPGICDLPHSTHQEFGQWACWLPSNCYGRELCRQCGRWFAIPIFPDVASIRLEGDRSSHQLYACFVALSVNDFQKWVVALGFLSSALCGRPRPRAPKPLPPQPYLRY